MFREILEHFFLSSRKGVANKGFVTIKKKIRREERAGAELQMKLASYSEGGCKVQGHSVTKKRERERKAFRAFTASIKAVTLLHGMFIVPLQPRQQLFSRAGLKNEATAVSLLLLCAWAFPVPSQRLRNSFHPLIGFHAAVQCTARDGQGCLGEGCPLPIWQQQHWG